MSGVLRCYIEHCSKRVHAHGLCPSHNHRLKRYGVPLGRPILPTDAERFWAKVDKSDNCWIWTAYRSTLGYGRFGRGGRAGHMEVASRVAWELTYGRVPFGMEVRHRCDNPPCVRPEHLEIGTHLENMRDMRDRGRQARGVRFPQAKLTDAAVREIRGVYRGRGKGGPTQEALAELYGVSREVIGSVVRRETWTHVR